MSSMLTTDQLREVISAKYEVIKPFARSQGLLDGLQVYFGDRAPQNAEGLYAYSDHEGYHYAATERGCVTSHRCTTDLFEISYWILLDCVFTIAMKCSAPANQDFRRGFFAKELELLALVGPEYRKRRDEEIQGILRSHPYNDAP